MTRLSLVNASVDKRQPRFLIDKDGLVPCHPSEALIKTGHQITAVSVLINVGALRIIFTMTIKVREMHISMHAGEVLL